MTLSLKTLLAVVLSAAVTAGLSAQDPVKPAAEDATPKEFKALKYRLDRAGRRRTRLACRRRAGRPFDLLRRDRVGRRLEVDRWRRHLEVGLRRPADLLDRLDRDRALEPERRLRRIGRGEHPRQRRRRATASTRSIDARQDLDARLEAGRADRHDGRPSRPTPTSRSPPCSATPSDRTPNAASIARTTAARPGSRS